ncbi:MAG: HEAT repeat domain-containing protein [Verrucomicrobiales bacterium]|nr:HEAT repeat domain-containing protein [Verrucomicrobiales bacterium]
MISTPSHSPKSALQPWLGLIALACSGLPLLAANPGGSGWVAAREQVRALKTPEGLEATVFAAEPQVVNPTDMDIDARGRIWCTEGANYRIWQKWGKLRPEGDRIVILEDTDGDGAADKQVVFYQGHEINAALGICVLGDSVIVSRSPNIFVFTDANHDDRADGPPKVLFTGIQGVDHDHGAHAFVFGPDGKLYFNIGNEGKQLQHPDGRLVVDLAGNEVITKGKPYRQGLAFRCNPDGSQLETVGWNFRNNYELCVDSFGTIWQSDNDDDGNRGVRINYVMEFGNYGYTDELTGASWQEAWKKAVSKGVPDSERPAYHWHLSDPGVVPNLLQTGNGSPTGIALYEGRVLPEVFRNQMIHCDAGPRVVRAYPVEKQGAGYQAKTVDLLTGPDSWFRPADVCVAPDGSVLVADWNDAGVGGHNMADQKLDTMTGRIYRVAPKGHRASVPKLDLSSARGAVAALQSPNQATRYLAWQALHSMGSKAESALKKLWRDPDPRLRARALQLLARIPGKEDRYVTAAIKDQNPDIRITGLRIARALNRDVQSLVKVLVEDPDAAVRRECAIALRGSKSPEMPALWVQLAQQYDGRDRWYLEALGIAADLRSDDCFKAWQTAVGDRWNSPAGREIIWRVRSKHAPALLAQLIVDKNTSTSDRSRFLRSLDFIKGPEKEAALLELITSGIQ